MSADSTVEQIDAVWWLARVRTNREQALSRELTISGTPHYLPVFKRNILRYGQRIEQKIPVFPGYVPYAGDRNSVLKGINGSTRHVLEVQEIKDQPRFVRELASIERALNADPSLMAHRSHSYHVGQKYRVMRGPLHGAVGYLERIDSQCRLVLRLSILGGAVATDVNPDDLELEA